LDARTGEALSEDGLEPVVTSNTGRRLRQVGLTRPMRYGPNLFGLAFCPDGETAIAYYRDSSIQLWDLHEGVPLCEPIPGAGRTNTTFSPDGKRFLIEHQGRLQVYNRTVSAARRWPLDIVGRRPVGEFAPDGKHAFLATNDSAWVWDAESGQIRHTIPQPDLIQVRGSATWLLTEGWMSPDGKRIVTAPGERGTTVRVFDVETGKLVQSLQHSGRVRLARFAGNESQVLTAGLRDGDQRITRWDVESGSVLAEGIVPAGGIGPYDVSPDGRFLAFTQGQQEEVIQVIDIATMQPAMLPLKNPSGNYFIHFSPDSRKLVGNGWNSSSRLWSIPDGRLLAELQLSNVSRTSAFSPDSRFLALADFGRYEAQDYVKVWDISQDEPRLIGGPFPHDNCIQSICFSPNGKLVLAGDRSGTTKLWDIETGQLVTDPVRHSAHVCAVRFHPHGIRYVSAPYNAEVELRELPPFEETPPDWLPALAEAVAGIRLNDAGAFETLGRQDLRQVKSLIASDDHESEATGFYERWSSWFFADRGQRLVAPFGSLNVQQEIEQHLQQDNLSNLHRGVRIDPANPRTLTALALRTLEYESIKIRIDPGSHFRTHAEWLADLAVQHAPSWSTGWVVKAMVEDRLGHAQAASVSVDQALKLNEHDVDAWALKSALLRSSGKLDEAEQSWKKVEAVLSQVGVMSASANYFLTPQNLATRLGKFDKGAILNQQQLGISGRTAETPKQMIDLTPFYTSGLNSYEVEQQAKLYQEGFAGARFDARGHARISSEYTASSIPSRLSGIPINQSFRRLHFLMSVSGDDLSGNDAVLRLKYVDGSTYETQLEIAASSDISSIRTVIENPQPEKQVAWLDVVPARRRTFDLRAMSLQLEDLPLILSQPDSQFVITGESVELSVEVSQEGPWNFTWIHNDSTTQVSTNRVLTIPTIDASKYGKYQVLISSATPDPAMLAVPSRQVYLVDPRQPTAHGSLKREIFESVPGRYVVDLVSSPRFPHKPDQADTIQEFANPSSFGENYGLRVTGLIVPPRTGEYVFYVCSDDASELYLSTNEFPDNKRRIASVSSYYERARMWTELEPTGISAPVHLQAGKYYYIEALMKEGIGGDHFSVAWQLPGQPPPQDGDPPIPGEYLALPVD